MLCMLCVLWCREALLGTDAGVIYELSVDEGKKERLRQLHELHGQAGPIAGLAQVRLASHPAGLAALMQEECVLMPGRCGKAEQTVNSHKHVAALLVHACLPADCAVPRAAPGAGAVRCTPARLCRGALPRAAVCCLLC